MRYQHSCHKLNVYAVFDLYFQKVTTITTEDIIVQLFGIIRAKRMSSQKTAILRIAIE